MLDCKGAKDWCQVKCKNHYTLPLDSRRQVFLVAHQYQCLTSLLKYFLFSNGKLNQIQSARVSAKTR